jgi:hypothetical protein
MSNLLVRNLRVIPRATAPRNILATRTFIVSAQQYKTATETVKDAAKVVDRTVSQAAIKGLEGVEKVNEAAKDAADKVGIKTEKKVDELEVEGKAAATKAQVKGDQAKRDAKAGVREAADHVKDAAR